MDRQQKLQRKSNMKKWYPEYKYCKIRYAKYCKQKRLYIDNRFAIYDIIVFTYDNYIQPASHQQVLNDIYTLYRKFNCDTVFVIVDEQYNYMNKWLDFANIPSFITTLIISSTTDYGKKLLEIEGIKPIAPHITTLIFHSDFVYIWEYIEFPIALKSFIVNNFKYNTIISDEHIESKYVSEQDLKNTLFIPPNLTKLYIQFSKFIGSTINNYIQLLPSSITELDVNDICGVFNLALLPNLRKLYTSCGSSIEFITNKPLSHEIAIKFMVFNYYESIPIFTEEIDESDILHHRKYRYKTLIIGTNIKKAKYNCVYVDIHNINDNLMYWGSIHLNYYISTFEYW